MLSPELLADVDEGHLYRWAEARLGERGGEALLARGPMVLINRCDRPAARLMRWQSIADPPAALTGTLGRLRGNRVPPRATILARSSLRATLSSRRGQATPANSPSIVPGSAR